MKAATAGSSLPDRLTIISIHAAREGGDLDDWIYAMDEIISIHAAREGGDIMAEYPASVSAISIHAAREGGDPFRG